ncbi:MAG: hypothetical protein GY865_16820, partial [candidate division Zixibacteria bacterium]|nr:hypothetical protein [candidate division Zixibacteria bacterium]
YQNKDRFVYFIDAGLAYHYASDFTNSNLKLTQAENAAEELFTKSITRAAASLLLNDNVLEYSGEDYEILYTNLIMALNYMTANDFDNAFVETKRANEKLNLLEQKYRKASDDFNQANENNDDTTAVDINYKAKKVKFNNDSFARYLSMRMYAADGYYDDALIDYNLLKRAFVEQPYIYNFDMPDIKYLPENKDNSILSIVGLAGLSPVKEALNLRLRTDKDLNLVQILYTDPDRKDSEYSHLALPVSEDYYFKFSIPEIVSRPSNISKIAVYANSDYLGELQLLEDVGTVATETFKAKKSLIYLRTIARAVFKGLAAHKAKKKEDKKKDGDGIGNWLKKALIDVATDISENADLRCSRLLPGKIYVGDFEIAPGIYNLRIEFLDDYDNIISAKEIIDYKVLKTGLNLIEAFSLN